ncbi:MAG: urease accessory protein UreE [Pseudomonadota bacterium]
MALIRATRVVPADRATDHVLLDYEGRLIRRKRLVSRGGVAFLVDLPEVVSVEDNHGFRLEDGSVIAVRAAPEALLSVTGDLPRLAWHLGNRHTPCRIEGDRLLIRDDHVLAAMLRKLGARVEAVNGPFSPEGGAYGHGRTLGHDHAHAHG